MKKSGKLKGVRLRVIGGDLGGRRIEYHGESFTRPMRDQVRENVFNLIGPSIRGTKVFDLFGGTGAMAIESISRGATDALLIEQNRRAAQVLKRTLESLDISNRIDVRMGDAFRVGRAQLESLAGTPQDADGEELDGQNGEFPNDSPIVVFFCPPYELWKKDWERLLSLIQLSQRVAPPGSSIVVETDKFFDASQLPGNSWDVRKYGDTQIAIDRPASICGYIPPSES